MDTITGNSCIDTVTTKNRLKKRKQDGPEVLMTTANLLRSGVKREFHAPFCSRGGEGDLPIDCNEHHKRVDGKLRRKYLGANRNLTAEKLQETAREISQGKLATK